MRYYEAPERVKYHGGYDPADPPQGEHWCSECCHWDDDCICEDEPPQETEQEHMKRMLEFGLSHKRLYRSDDCAYCQAHKDDSMMPPHQASSNCESGRYDHCTCDTCY